MAKVLPSPEPVITGITPLELTEENYGSNLNQAADLVGFSTQSRVYDLFVSIEGVTPNQYKTHGQGLEIQYGFNSTPFGECFMALTKKGLCALSFVEETNKETTFKAFLDRWQGAKLVQNTQNTEGGASTNFRPEGH